MIALLTIHYHSPETLCIQSDGGRGGGGGGGKEEEEEGEREGVGSGFGGVFVCWRARR